MHISTIQLYMYINCYASTVTYDQRLSCRVCKDCQVKREKQEMLVQMEPRVSQEQME